MSPGTSPVPVLDSLQAVDRKLHQLLVSTICHERLVAERDHKIALIQKEHSPAIDKTEREIMLFTSQIEQYCLAHPESLEDAGKKSKQLKYGMIGLRAPSHPALVPLSDKWTWESIAAKVKELWKKKYFHPPKPPALDKVKLKKGLDEKQLAKCGLKLDTTETFYLELNRLAIPDETAAAARD